MKILIADDESAVLELLSEMVEPLEHEPVLAGGGAEAWELFERQPCRLVITDWLMPGVDGLELTRRIRARKRVRYTYVIMLTALGGAERYLEGMRAGTDDFVTKPISQDELLARVRVAERILALQDDVRRLEGMLRICMYCKKVHVTEGDWTTIERYVEERSDASFSHDICPACYTTRVDPDLQQFIGGIHDADDR